MGQFLQRAKASRRSHLRGSFARVHVVDALRRGPSGSRSGTPRSGPKGLDLSSGAGRFTWAPFALAGPCTASEGRRPRKDDKPARLFQRHARYLWLRFRLGVGAQALQAQFHTQPRTEHSPLSLRCFPSSFLPCFLSSRSVVLSFVAFGPFLCFSLRTRRPLEFWSPGSTRRSSWKATFSKTGLSRGKGKKTGRAERPAASGCGRACASAGGCLRDPLHCTSAEFRRVSGISALRAAATAAASFPPAKWYKRSRGILHADTTKNTSSAHPLLEDPFGSST